MISLSEIDVPYIRSLKRFDEISYVNVQNLSEIPIIPLEGRYILPIVLPLFQEPAPDFTNAEKDQINHQALKLSDTLYMNEVFSESEAISLASERMKKTLPERKQKKLDELEAKGRTFKNYYFEFIKTIFQADDLHIMMFGKPDESILITYRYYSEQRIRVGNSIKGDFDHSTIFSYLGYVCPEYKNSRSIKRFLARKNGFESLFNSLDYVFVTFVRKIINVIKDDHADIISEAIDLIRRIDLLEKSSW